MQVIYDDIKNTVGPVEEFDEGKLYKALQDGAECVNVFQEDSPAHVEAKKKYKDMTRNQKKRLRKKNRKR